MDHVDRSPGGTATPWSRTIRRTILLLAVWFLVGPVLGILMVEPLNELSLGGIPLGFWVSQQGSIYVFVILIFVYAILGDRSDRETPTQAPGAGFAGREG
jgi:putative solute:sodium symporter small subunit